MDYAAWSEIDRRMRAQERRWHHGKKESREQYLVRLRRTAMRLPPKFINSFVMNMKVTCHRMYMAKGGHFEEGGRRAERGHRSAAGTT